MKFQFAGSTTNFHKYTSKETVGTLYIPRTMMEPALPEIKLSWEAVKELA